MDAQPCGRAVRGGMEFTTCGRTAVWARSQIPPPAVNPGRPFLDPGPPGAEVKNRCMEMSTMVTPMQKLMLSACPKSTADMSPVKMVATVLLYFFKMVSANLKKKEERIPCAALFAAEQSRAVWGA